MEKILNFMHGFFLWTFTLITLICVDLPLKVIGCVLILIIGLICAIFHPLVKKIARPVCGLSTLYSYVTTQKLISKHVYNLWL